MSGPAVRAVALAQVAEVSGAFGFPSSAWVGYSAAVTPTTCCVRAQICVAVGTESFRDPLAGARVRRELQAIRPGRVSRCRLSASAKVLQSAGNARQPPLTALNLNFRSR